MSILCGTDFSERSRQAADVAAHFAARTDAPLHLAHAYDERIRARWRARPSGDALARIEAELAARGRAAARHRCGRAQAPACRVRPDEVLLDLATELTARS